jgi:hypothetical protein
MRSEAQVWVRSIFTIAGSIPAEGMDACPFCVFSQVAASCDELITRPEESYLVYVSNFVWYTNRNNEAV